MNIIERETSYFRCFKPLEINKYYVISDYSLQFLISFCSATSRSVQWAWSWAQNKLVNITYILINVGSKIDILTALYVDTISWQLFVVCTPESNLFCLFSLSAGGFKNNSLFTHELIHPSMRTSQKQPKKRKNIVMQ